MPNLEKEHNNDKLFFYKGIKFENIAPTHTKCSSAHKKIKKKNFALRHTNIWLKFFLSNLLLNTQAFYKKKERYNFREIYPD